MFPLCLSLSSPQMGLGPLGFVYNRWEVTQFSKLFFFLHIRRHSHGVPLRRALLSFPHQSPSLSATVTQTSSALSRHTHRRFSLLYIQPDVHTPRDAISLNVWVDMPAVSLNHAGRECLRSEEGGEERNLEEVQNISLQPWMLCADKAASLVVCSRLYAHTCVSFLYRFTSNTR